MKPNGKVVFERLLVLERAVLHSSPAVNLLDPSADEVSVFKASDMLLCILVTHSPTHTHTHLHAFTRTVLLCVRHTHTHTHTHTYTQYDSGRQNVFAASLGSRLEGPDMR